MNEKPNMFSILTASVRYDNRLTDSEKILFSEITALTNKSGECWASNNYFSELYGVTPQAISKRINKLKQLGYLEIEFIRSENGKNIEKRIIRLTGLGVSTTVDRYQPEIKGGINSGLRGYQRTIKENNTSINNTSINSNGKTRFSPPTLTQVTDYCNERKNNVDPQRFIDYYESNGWKVGKNKMKDWQASVRTWERRESKDGKDSSNEDIYQQWNVKRI